MTGGAIAEFARWTGSARLTPHERAAAAELLRELGTVEPGPPVPAGAAGPAPTVPGADFLAKYPAEMREAALDRLRESDPRLYRTYAARYRALAIRS